MKLKIYLTAIISLFLIVSLTAQSDVTKEPGYVDFGNFDAFQDADGVTEVFLEEELLSALAQISPDEDPNMMALLSDLKLVKVNVFHVNESIEGKIDARINEIDRKLSGTEWKRIVKSKEKDERANVYIKLGKNKKDVVGLVVTTMEKNGDAAFVNIVGNIDLKNIGKLGNKFDIPTLDKIKDE